MTMVWLKTLRCSRAALAVPFTTCATHRYTFCMSLLEAESVSTYILREMLSILFLRLTGASSINRQKYKEPGLHQLDPSLKKQTFRKCNISTEHQSKQGPNGGEKEKKLPCVEIHSKSEKYESSLGVLRCCSESKGKSLLCLPLFWGRYLCDLSCVSLTWQ